MSRYLVPLYRLRARRRWSGSGWASRCRYGWKPTEGRVKPAAGGERRAAPDGHRATVRVRDGETKLTDGPFRRLGPQEMLGGFLRAGLRRPG